VRDLCRTRGDMVEDLTRARNRLTKFLLRHSVVWRDGSNWTFKHQRWLAGLRFDDRALAATFAHYHATVELRDNSLAAIEEDLAPYCDRAPFGGQVHHLAAYRGVTRMGGLCMAAEVFDWRRFPAARSFMSFTGLVPSENSTGLSEQRGNITHAGNRHLRAQLVEAPGPTSTDHTSVPASPPATTASHPRSSHVPGPRKCVCRHGSANSLLARTSAPSPRPPSHASSPDSCGPK
jgi:transposase